MSTLQGFLRWDEGWMGENDECWRVDGERLNINRMLSPLNNRVVRITIEDLGPKPEAKADEDA